MKMPDYAMNSVFAKVRALYGNRLTKKNYSDMLNLNSINDIAEYLRTKTAYSEIFEGLSATEVYQRSRLENLLFNKMYNEMISVERFQKAAGNNLYEYFIMKYDIEQIIKVLSSLETKSDSYFFTFPLFYNERSKLDLYKISLAKSDQDILECTKNTVYHTVLRDALPKYRLSGNLTVLQTVFRNFLDEQFLLLLIGKSKGKIPEKNETINLCKTINDINLVRMIYRIKRFDVTADIVEYLSSPVLTSFTKKQLNEMISAQTEEQTDEAVKKTYMSGLVDESHISGRFQATENYLFRILTNALRRSNDPETVMFAYFNLSQAEIRNIIHIIEGVRYGLPPEEILPMLSGQDIS